MSEDPEMQPERAAHAELAEAAERIFRRDGIKVMSAEFSWLESGRIGAKPHAVVTATSLRTDASR